MTWSQDNGALALLIARCIPIVPFFALNYAAGLSGMKWSTYNAVTAIGILPAILTLSIAGEHALALHWSIWVAIALIFVLAMWLLKRLAIKPTHEDVDVRLPNHVRGVSLAAGTRLKQR